MSIQRFIHPAIWRCPELAALPPDAQLLFIGCFSTADDHGRRRAEPELLKADIFPLRDDILSPNLGQLRDKLSQVGLIRVYGDGKYLDLPTWEKFQRPKYRRPSRIPPFVPDSGTNPGQIRDKPGTECPGTRAMGLGLGLGREGFGFGAVSSKPTEKGPGQRTPVEEAKVRAAYLRKRKAELAAQNEAAKP